MASDAFVIKHLDAKLIIYANTRCSHAEMSAKAQEYAGKSFNLETILGQTMRFFHGQTLKGDKEDAARENVAPFPSLGSQVVFDPRVQDAYNVFAEK